MFNFISIGSDWLWEGSVTWALSSLCPKPAHQDGYQLYVDLKQSLATALKMKMHEASWIRSNEQRSVKSKRTTVNESISYQDDLKSRMPSKERSWWKTPQHGDWQSQLREPFWDKIWMAVAGNVTRIIYEITWYIFIERSQYHLTIYILEYKAYLEANMSSVRWSIESIACLFIMYRKSTSSILKSTISDICNWRSWQPWRMVCTRLPNSLTIDFELSVVEWMISKALCWERRGD